MKSGHSLGADSTPGRGRGRGRGRGLVGAVHVCGGKETGEALKSECLRL